MNTQTTQTNPSQNDPKVIIVSEEQDDTQLYDSHTPDSYDAHIIPAETAARKDREGENFKHLAKHPGGYDHIDTAGGFKVDKEGLMDNFAIEPQMYYETPGDLPEEIRQEAVRQEAIHQEKVHQEVIRQDEIRQDAIHQEEIHQKAINQEAVHQQKVHQDEIRQDEIRQEAIHQEELHQQKVHQEEIRQQRVHQQKVRQEKIHQEKIHQEEIHQEEIHQDAINQEEIRQDAINQDAIHQEVIRQDAIRQEEIRQEAIRQEAIRQETIRQEKILILHNSTDNTFQEKTIEFQQLGVGTFSSYETTEIALGELKDNGFLMDKVSLVGRNINSHTEVTGTHTSNRLGDFDNLDTDENQAKGTAQDGAIGGGAVGGFAGLLVGLGLIAIPGVGPVMLAGAAATAIVSAISGGVIGAAAGSLAGGLVGLGIPADRAKVYSDRISAGDYLVMVKGSEADITLAESVFSNHHIDHWHTYDLSHDLSDDLSDDSVQTTKTLPVPRLRV